MEKTTIPKQITSADENTNVLVRSKPGVLGDYNILITSAHTVEVYDDNQAGTQVAANLKFTIPASAVAGNYKLNCVFSKGIVLKVAASFAANHLITHTAG